MQPRPAAVLEGLARLFDGEIDVFGTAGGDLASTSPVAGFTRVEGLARRLGGRKLPSMKACVGRVRPPRWPCIPRSSEDPLMAQPSASIPGDGRFQDPHHLFQLPLVVLVERLQRRARRAGASSRHLEPCLTHWTNLPPCSSTRISGSMADMMRRPW
jgi:hypothetical protein